MSAIRRVVSGLLGIISHHFVIISFIAFLAGIFSFLLITFPKGPVPPCTSRVSFPDFALTTVDLVYLSVYIYVGFVMSDNRKMLYFAPGHKLDQSKHTGASGATCI